MKDKRWEACNSDFIIPPKKFTNNSEATDAHRLPHRHTRMRLELDIFAKFYMKVTG